MFLVSNPTNSKQEPHSLLETRTGEDESGHPRADTDCDVGSLSALFIANGKPMVGIRRAHTRNGRKDESKTRYVTQEIKCSISMLPPIISVPVGVFFRCCSEWQLCASYCPALPSENEGFLPRRGSGSGAPPHLGEEPRLGAQGMPPEGIMADCHPRRFQGEKTQNPTHFSGKKGPGCRLL
jgi:hypothetical protein